MLTGSGDDVGCVAALGVGGAGAVVEADGAELVARLVPTQAASVTQLSVPHADAMKEATTARTIATRTALVNAARPRLTQACAND